MCKWYVPVRLSFLAICLIATNLASGQTLDRRLSGTFPNEGGPITISTTGSPVVTTGLQFSTSSGSITLGESAAPYETARQSDNKILTEFGFNRVVLSGSITLDAVASKDTVAEASWIQPSNDGVGGSYFNFPFQGGDAARFGIQGSYPYDGGPVTIEPTLAEFPINVRKLEFEATTGTISTEGIAAPFASIDATSKKWTASSDSDVLIDGPITLDLNYTSQIQVEGLDGKVWDANGSSSFVVARQQPKFTNQLRGSTSPNGPILVESTSGPVALRGLDFIADRGAIRGGTNPAPFQSVTANRIDRWTLRSDAEVVLDGQMQLDATADSFSTIKGFAWDGSSSTQFEMTNRPTLDFEVSYPFDGGPLSIKGAPTWPREDAMLTSVDVRVTAGQLSNGTNPAPFQTLTNNSSEQWSAESNADLVLPFGEEITLDVVASSGSTGTATISRGVDSLTVDITRNPPSASSNLIGAYSLTKGGPVSLASNRPVSMRNLRIDAVPNHGKLTGGGSAAPFESLTTNSNTTWAVESSSDVTIEGIVELDLVVEPETFLEGQAFNGTTTSQVIFNGVASTGGTGRLSAAYPEEGGKMLVLNSGHPLHASGLEFVAEPGILTAGDDPSPFPFFIPNSAPSGNVTFGALGTPVTIDGVLELDILVAEDTPEGTIIATKGGGVVPTAFPVYVMPNLEKFAAPTTTCIVPDDELVGDLDNNDTVEFRDFLILAGNFGLEVETYGEGDMNCNGTVDFEDFLRLANRFGNTRTAEAHTVPEPSSLGLFLFGFFALAATRKRRRQHIARNTCR